MTKFVCVLQCERSVKEKKKFHLSLSISLFRTVRLDWSHPGRPNGIMQGYEVLRRTLRSCAVGLAGVTSSVEGESEGASGLRFRCSYLQCPASHSVCGTSCFNPNTQVNNVWPINAFCSFCDTKAAILKLWVLFCLLFQSRDHVVVVYPLRHTHNNNNHLHSLPSLCH